MHNISNKMSTDFYIENYKTVKIPISSTINSTGFLSVDEYQQELYSLLNLGVTRIRSIVGYSANYLNSLLIYNDENYSLHKDFITSNNFSPIIHPNKVTKYKINARMDRVEHTDDSPIFLISLTGRSVFNVRINGKLTTDFTANSTGITITNTLLLDPYENELEVIHYSTNQTITTDFYMSYWGVENRYDIEISQCNSDFFDSMIKLETLESFSDSINRTLVDIGNIRENSEDRIVTNSDNSITLGLMGGSFELISEVSADKPFRVVKYDPMSDILTYYANCKIYTGVNSTSGDTTDVFNYTINFEDRVIVYGATPVNSYGAGLYSEGYYSIKISSANYGIKIY